MSQRAVVRGGGGLPHWLVVQSPWSCQSPIQIWQEIHLHDLLTVTVTPGCEPCCTQHTGETTVNCLHG